MVVMLVATGIAQASDGVRDATAKELAAIKAGLETSLKDAGSAKLQNVRFKGETFCGLVNAKNSYGAYAGYVPIKAWFLILRVKKLQQLWGLAHQKLRDPYARRRACRCLRPNEAMFVEALKPQQHRSAP